MTKLISKIFVFIGILFIILSGFLYWQRITPRRVSFDLESAAQISNTRPESQSRDAVPEKIVIDELGIELPVFETEVVDSRWQATTKGANYLASSALPGKTGNSILYGHNWESLLGPLTEARPGQKIKILLSDGTAVNYVVNSTQTVSPDQTSVLADSNDKRLTIYTCTGFLDRKRFVVSALAEKV